MWSLQQLSPQMIASVLVVIFSYLIWVQSTRYNKKDIEDLLRSRHVGSTFASKDNRVGIEVFDCFLEEPQFLKRPLYYLSKVFRPFGKAKGTVDFHIFPLRDPENWKIPKMKELKEKGVFPQELVEYKVYKPGAIKTRFTLDEADSFSRMFEEFLDRLAEQYAQTEDVGNWKRVN